METVLEVFNVVLQLLLFTVERKLECTDCRSVKFVSM